MALWICRGCTAAYAVGAPACPHCGSTEFREDHEEDGMAKITLHGGPSNEHAQPGEVGYIAAPEEEVDECPGSSSETSSKPDETSPKTSDGGPDSPAPTTASRSGKARTGSSTARGTAGGRTARVSATDAADGGDDGAVDAG